MFYKSFIEGVICFSCICWYFNLSVKNKNSLHKIVRISSKIIGDNQRDIIKFCEERTLRKARTILVDKIMSFSQRLRLKSNILLL